MSETVTLEQLRRYWDEVRLRAVPKFTQNGVECYVYLRDEKRFATVLDNIEAS